jgi:hypothetical protein
MRLIGGRGHLTYCTNIHPGESWEDSFAALAAHLPIVKRAICPDQPFGVGLRVSALAATQLSAPDILARFQGFLAGHRLYVFTINGFPYGTFHGTRVKTSVYRPDWRDPARLAYTNRLADLLAALLPDGETGSISTVPCGWAADFDPDSIDLVVEHLLRAAVHLHQLHRRTGKVLTLALEPEPGCFLDATADAKPLFDRLRGHDAVARFAGLAGATPSEAQAALHRHLGLCLDLCHLAVGFERPADSLALLRDEGIAVFKLQVSAGLRLSPAAAAALAPFDDGVYLHQATARRGADILRFTDLDDVRACTKARDAEEWRVHVHVPLWADHFGALGSTADITAECLALHAAAPVCQHLEVETYTWDVLPAALRPCDLDTAIVKELQWTIRQLG